MTGFADEAGGDLDTQIRVTKELGRENIEANDFARCSGSSRMQGSHLLRRSAEGMI